MNACLKSKNTIIHTIAVVPNIICVADARESFFGIIALSTILTGRWLAEITFCKMIKMGIALLPFYCIVTKRRWVDCGRLIFNKKQIVFLHDTQCL